MSIDTTAVPAIPDAAPPSPDLLGPVAHAMAQRLTAALAPVRLVITDDSHHHQGHAGHDGRGESHFSVEVESPAFAGQSRVARQRMVYTALGELMAERIHALSICALAPGEERKA